MLPSTEVYELAGIYSLVDGSWESRYPVGLRDLREFVASAANTPAVL